MNPATVSKAECVNTARWANWHVVSAKRRGSWLEAEYYRDIRKFWILSARIKG